MYTPSQTKASICKRMEGIRGTRNTNPVKGRAPSARQTVTDISILDERWVLAGTTLVPHNRPGERASTAVYQLETMEFPCLLNKKQGQKSATCSAAEAQDILVKCCHPSFLQIILTIPVPGLPCQASHCILPPLAATNRPQGGYRCRTTHGFISSDLCLLLNNDVHVVLAGEVPPSNQDHSSTAVFFQTSAHT